MSELDVLSLKPGDPVGYTFSRGRLNYALGVRRTTVARVTTTQIVLHDGLRFYRLGERAGRLVGDSGPWTRQYLVALESPEARASRIHDEFHRAHNALKELGRVSPPKTYEEFHEHLGAVVRVVTEAKARLDGGAA
jgi:hypothetical protein